jgi:hypothetical protein
MQTPPWYNSSAKCTYGEEGFDRLHPPSPREHNYRRDLEISLGCPSFLVRPVIRLVAGYTYKAPRITRQLEWGLPRFDRNGRVCTRTK